MNLNSEHRQALEKIADQLLSAFPYQRRTPWAIFEILEQTKRHSTDFPPLETLLPVELAQWLLQRDEWAKVGRDLWFPKHLLPQGTQNRRYAVLPVETGEKGQKPFLLELIETAVQSADQTINQGMSGEKQSSVSQQTPVRNRWKIVLRTLHLNEGYIPIPSYIRTLYPHNRNRDKIIVLPGIWFTDASSMTVWLDMTHHRLYGPDVTDQLAFLDAGTILEIFWSDAGYTFNLAGQDSDVFEEEARLIDLTELAQVRSTLLESYRASLRILLALAPQGKVFPELYLELCQRQQHKPNRSTIRAILSSSPEFYFDKSEKQWKLLPSVPEEIGASALRKVAVAAQQSASPDSNQSLETPSLATMIAKNRQQLVDLRNFYRSKPNHT